MSRISTKNSVRWVIALIPEAIPIIHALRLKKISGKLPFPIYIDDEGEHWLTVSGLGQANIANATSFLFKKSGADKTSVWINVGIAGSKTFDLGELVFIDKVTSNISGKSLYPYSIPNLKIENRSELITVNSPERVFGSDGVYDMEGFSFFEVTSKLSSNELILILKIVSDGPDSDLSKIDKDKISILIEKKIPALLKILPTLFSISQKLKDQMLPPKNFEDICKIRKFTFSQRVTLKKLLNQWHARKASKSLIKNISVLKTASKIIQFMEKELNRS
jgi:hypothetical protein